ncbi:lysylphosphatidylglycerol synthase domain-containing protein [Actinomadura macrotermitis]|uniref:Uncharacterized protein n=1 Tax=Actinomadura macrotermitis TaxID=2585200 RepID=A0A7K0BRE4_9ACTN|nr:lysylphosphatidylglycerol synthase domain-containing protein [Actinomadura macrotermitis]MQY03596.1 hypothetical protein [Actinomadura macrotermitis]
MKRSLAGAVILALVVWRLGTDAFADGFRAVSAPAIAAALGIGLLTTACSAARWWLVARRLGLRLAPMTALLGYYRAQLLNAVLPAGVLGDVHRAVDHGRQAGDVGRGVRAVVLERVAGQVVLISAGAAFLFRGPWLAVLALLPAVLLWGRARRALTDLRLGTWVLVLLLSAVALAGHIALFIVAARSAGAAAPIGRLVPMALLALLAMSLPVNIGGWGPREAVTASAFGAAGMGAAQGLATSVVYGVLVLVACLPGVAALLPRQRRQAPAERLDQGGEQLPALVGGRQ